MIKAEKKTLKLSVEKPQYITVNDITYAQVDSWFGHCRRDLKLDIIYPETKDGKIYPCILWICGGAWLMMDKSAHNLYLSRLASSGFVVASVEYRTSNQGPYPMPLQDVKAAIRYLKAHADRFRINKEQIGVMGESAGGNYVVALTARLKAKGKGLPYKIVGFSSFLAMLDVGEYLEESSKVQAACPWYPPTDLSAFPCESAEKCASSAESLLLGFNSMLNKEKAYQSSPVSKVTKDAPPFLIIHGNCDQVVPYVQSETLYGLLEKKDCDVTLLTLDGADHADIQFFQDEVWNRIAEFFHEKLK